MTGKLPLLWREEFKVRAYEVDPRGRLTVQSLFNYMQEAAGNHAAELGVSVEQLFRDNLTWVLSRVHLRIDYYPVWKQRIIIETWPADKDTYYAIRDFRILDEKGRSIGLASSSWMMIDVKLRRPVPLPAYIEQIKNHENGRALNVSFDKLPKLQRVDQEKTFKVRLSDLDINQHVNSVNFIEWAIEAVPPEINQKYQLSQVEISYRAEAKYGDCLFSQCQIENNVNESQIIHRLLKESDQKELARVLTTWQAI